MIALFCITIGIGLVAICVVALNILLVVKTVNVNVNTGDKDYQSDEQPRPVAQASPFGAALPPNPNTVELAFGLRGESTYAVVDYTSAAGAANVPSKGAQ